MSNTSFQERLHRIGANSEQTPPLASDKPNHKPPQARKPGLSSVGIGGGVMMLGVQVLKYVNGHYEAIKHTSGAATLAGLGFAGIAGVLIGVYLILRAAFKMYAVRTNAAEIQSCASEEQPVRKASAKARVFLSLIGYVFGTIACFHLFMMAAARHVETEKAQIFANMAFLVALSFLLLSLVFGIVGLFLRGKALGRVPICFFLGGVITYSAVRVLKLNMLEWQGFMAALQ